MEWDKLTNQKLFNWLVENYTDKKFELKENGIICKLGSNVECDYHVGMLSKKMEWWNSLILVHVGVTQTKGTLQGSSGAVDNFDDLKIYVEDCFKRGKDWVDVQKSKNVVTGKKEIRKRLF